MGVSVLASAIARHGDCGRKGALAPFPEKLHPGGRCRRIRRTRPPCVPHRHARRAVRGMKRQGRSDAPPLPPCRRRETIFRRPLRCGLTSFPRHKRRPRLTATPGSVSVAGREDCRHGSGGWGKRGVFFRGGEGVPCGWILGSSPRMTTEGKGMDEGSGSACRAVQWGPGLLLPSVILGLDPRIHPHGTPLPPIARKPRMQGHPGLSGSVAGGGAGLYSSPILSAAMKASCGISTLPNWRMRFLPAFCFSKSLRLRVASPP